MENERGELVDRKIAPHGGAAAASALPNFDPAKRCLAYNIGIAVC